MYFYTKPVFCIIEESRLMHARPMCKTFSLLVLLLLISPFVSGQIFNEPRQIQALLKQLEEELPVPSRIDVLNRLSYGYSQAFKADSGILYAEEALLLAEKYRLQKEMAKSHYNLGYAMQNLGIHSEAIQEFETGITLAANTDDRTLTGWLNHAIGQSYYMMKVYGKALDQQRYTLAYAKENEIGEIIPIAHNSIGNIFLWQHKGDSALYYFTRGLEAARLYRNEFMMAVGYKNLGRAYLLQNDHKNGLQAFWESIEIAGNSKSEHTRTVLTQSYESMAIYEYEHGNYDKCIEYAGKSLEVSKEYQTVEDMYDASQVLYKAHKAKGNATEALNYLELNQQIYETMYKRLEVINRQALENRLQIARQKANISLLSEKNIRKEEQQHWLILGLAFSLLAGIWLFWLYRLVGKQKEVIKANNLQLEQKVIERTDELELAYNEVESALTKGQTIERKRIAADIHDHLGGILSSASIGMELIDQKGLSDREKQILNNIKNQIHDAYDEIRLLSHNLKPDVVEKEGLKVALDRMAQRITLLHNIKVVQSVRYTSVLSKMLEYNLYFVVMELLNNIIKHAGATKIEISIDEPQNGLLQLQIKDNGKGFVKNPESKPDGIGLMNITERLAQVNGTIAYTSEKGKTVFLIGIQVNGMK